MTLSIAKYDDDDAYYVVNPADHHADMNALDDDAPEIMKELRREIIEIILRVAHKPGEQIVKVAMGNRPPVGAVRGYATLLRFLEGCGLPELEGSLGFRSGALQSGGAYIYNVDPHALKPTNVAPRGNTDWSGGVTPRDLHNLSLRHGVPVGYHRDYPSATRPVFQFAILEPVPFLGQPRFIRMGETV